MALTLKLSIGFYCLVGLLLMLGGLNYILTPTFMAYHAAAVQTPWDQVPALYQGLIRSLMIPGLVVLHLAISRYASHVLYATTGGGPPRAFALTFAALAWGALLCALALSLVGWPRKA